MFRAAVHLTLSNPYGAVFTFAPGDEVPDELAALVSNPAALEGSPLGAAGTGAKSAPENVEPVRAETVANADASDGPVEPPRAGRGASRDAWAAHAERLGVEFDADASRETIIAAVDDAMLD